MNRARQPRSVLVNLIRIIHIALWFTISTTFWLWLVHAPPPQPRACEPYCGWSWHQGNVLDISQDSNLFIVIALFFLGIAVFGCWIAGYCLEITSRVTRGDRMLPPVHRGHLRQGVKLFWYSLAFWAPFIFAFICVSLVFDAVRSEFTLRATWYVMAVTVAIMPVMLLGNLVGIARYAAYGDRALVYRRLENIGLALGNFFSTFVFSSAIIVLLMVSLTVIPQGLLIIYELQVSDVGVELALISFHFYSMLLCASFFSSHLVALFAQWIGVCDSLGHGASHESKHAGA